MSKIELHMLIEDIVEQYPQTIGPMQEMGVQCILCGEPVWGTLGDRIQEKKLKNGKEILAKLNTIVENENAGAGL